MELVEQFRRAIACNEIKSQTACFNPPLAARLSVYKLDELAFPDLEG